MVELDLFAGLVAGLPSGVIVWELEDESVSESLRLVYANPTAERALGLPLMTRRGERMRAIFPTTDDDAIATYSELCRKRTARELGVREFPADPPIRFLVRTAPVLERGVAVFFEDLAVIARADPEIRALNSFLDSIIEQVPAMIFVKDGKDLRFKRFNRAGEELLGLSRDQLIGRNDYDFFPRHQADFFVEKDRAVLASRALEDIPSEPIQTPRGTRWLHTRKIPILDPDGNATDLLGVSIDITERRQAEEVLRASKEELEEKHLAAQKALESTEEQLRQSQKMEAVGRLAGGVAHDFNNLLTVILGYCEFLLADIEPNDPRRSHVEEIREAGRKAGDLTQRLLAFGRKQVLQPRIIDLGEIVEGMKNLIRRLVGEDIAIDFRIETVVARVKADPSQFEQVVMNLVVNARDAMPTGGRLAITLAEAEIEPGDPSGYLATKVGPHVMLEVADSGAGMTAETMERMFEPFFTTKGKGQGSGLGLSIVFGILRQSEGAIRVESTPGQGSKFRVYFPAVDVSTEPARPPTQPASGGRETILLVEDEVQVRQIAAEVLKRAGYRVIEAPGGEEALEAARGHPGAIDLLLTDVVMPGMGGRALAEALTRERPETAVLFMSGYTDDAIVRHGVREAEMDFVQKPITPERLSAAVRGVLDKKPKSPSA